MDLGVRFEHSITRRRGFLHSIHGTTHYAAIFLTDHGRTLLAAEPPILNFGNIKRMRSKIAAGAAFCSNNAITRLPSPFMLKILKHSKTRLEVEQFEG